MLFMFISESEIWSLIQPLAFYEYNIEVKGQIP